MTGGARAAVTGGAGNGGAGNGGAGTGGAGIEGDARTIGIIAAVGCTAITTGGGVGGGIAITIGRVHGIGEREHRLHSVGRRSTDAIFACISSPSLWRSAGRITRVVPTTRPNYWAICVVNFEHS